MDRRAVIDHKRSGAFFGVRESSPAFIRHGETASRTRFGPHGRKADVAARGRRLGKDRRTQLSTLRASRPLVFFLFPFRLVPAGKMPVFPGMARNRGHTRAPRHGKEQTENPHSEPGTAVSGSSGGHLPSPMPAKRELVSTQLETAQLTLGLASVPFPAVRESLREVVTGRGQDLVSCLAKSVDRWIGCHRR